MKYVVYILLVVGCCLACGGENPADQCYECTVTFTAERPNQAIETDVQKKTVCGQSEMQDYKRRNTYEERLSGVYTKSVTDCVRQN